MQPLIVVSDVHLAHSGRNDVSRDLGRLIDAHPGHEIVLNGDIFNLSCDRPHAPPAPSVAAMLKAESALSTAIRQHVLAGHRLTLIPGNHDAGVLAPDVRSTLLSALELQAGAPLVLQPWFLRRDGVHIEHGHVYDPDNAPAHPLSPPQYRSEPLGVALARRFLAPFDAFYFTHEHEAPPLRATKIVFEKAGLRAPLVVLRFFTSAAAICAETLARFRLSEERENGEARLPRCAEENGVEESTLRELLRLGSSPTHTSFPRTFMRLYFDRTLATLSVPAGVVAGLLTGPLGFGLSVAGLGYLALSLKSGTNRYPDRMASRLFVGAELVRRLTQAKLVVFGHTHREEGAEGYINTGSFGYPTGAERCFVRIDEQGAAERRFLPGSTMRPAPSQPRTSRVGRQAHSFS
jgi:hypothetical protein